MVGFIIKRCFWYDKGYFRLENADFLNNAERTYVIKNDEFDNLLSYLTLKNGKITSNCLAIFYIILSSHEINLGTSNYSVDQFRQIMLNYSQNHTNRHTFIY